MTVLEGSVRLSMSMLTLGKGLFLFLIVWVIVLLGLVDLALEGPKLFWVAFLLLGEKNLCRVLELKLFLVSPQPKLL